MNMRFTFAEMEALVASAPQDDVSRIRAGLSVAYSATGGLYKAAALVAKASYLQAVDAGWGEPEALFLAEFVTILAVHDVAAAQGGQAYLDEAAALNALIESAFDGDDPEIPEQP